MLDKIFPTNNKKSQAKVATSPEEKDYYRLIKNSLYLSTFSSNNKCVPEDQAILQWRIEAPDGLSDNQKTLNKKLLDFIHSNNILGLEKFLNNNKKNKDLKAVLDLKRGKSELTLLHVFCMNNKDILVNDLLNAGADSNIRDREGKTPLHYAYSYNVVNLLMENKANPNIRDNRGRTPLHDYADDIYPNNETILCMNLLVKKGADLSAMDNNKKTPMQIAVDNNFYNTECLFNDRQKKLHEELYKIINSICGFTDWVSSPTINTQHLESLKNFFDQHKNNEDLKIVLSNKDEAGNLKVLEVVPKNIYANVSELIKKVIQVKEERDKKATHSLFDTYLEQQDKIRLEFVNKLSQAKNMPELQRCVNDVIDSGIMLNFVYRQRVEENTDKRQIYFLDSVIARISELEENPKIASDIICKLISRGAVCRDSTLNIFDKQLSKHKEHVTNTIEAYDRNLDRNRKFVEIAESAAIGGKLDSAIVDNATFYLKYSKDSKIDVAKITDGAKSLGLVKGNVVCGKDIIKIGKSEVEVETRNGKRNYTNLADGSDVVLTFCTSEGKLEVRLYTDMKNKDLVKVEVMSQETLAKLKGRNEKIGSNCLLGGLSINDAIDKGYFVRFGKFQLPETMRSYQEPQEDKNSWQDRVKQGQEPKQSMSK